MLVRACFFVRARPLRCFPRSRHSTQKMVRVVYAPEAISDRIDDRVARSGIDSTQIRCVASLTARARRPAVFVLFLVSYALYNSRDLSFDLSATPSNRTHLQQRCWYHWYVSLPAAMRPHYGPRMRPGRRIMLQRGGSPLQPPQLRSSCRRQRPPRRPSRSNEPRSRAS